MFVSTVFGRRTTTSRSQGEMQSLIEDAEGIIGAMHS